MPSGITVDSKFIGGLKTESTVLNFSEDSCTETFDCVFNRTGIVNRRFGFDYEAGFHLTSLNKTDKAVSTYYWRNVIGDGEVSILVVQLGTTLYFYRSSDATLTSPLSTTKLTSTINLNSFKSSEVSSVDATIEAQFTDGNGYLFVFHPNIDPIYCSYLAGTVTGNVIGIKIRDFTGIAENIDESNRPFVLTQDHYYNLLNQGWSSGGSDWSTLSNSTVTANLGNIAFTVSSGLTITPGQSVSVNSGEPHTAQYNPIMRGTVTSYSGTALVINITGIPVWYVGITSGSSSEPWTINSVNANYITTWFSAVGNYPSNADVWWQYKDATNVFSPSTTIANVTVAGPAPKGHYILPAFSQDRTQASGLAGLSLVTTNGIRPTTGVFFQGRVWYAGVNSTSFNENIYFSQIIENTNQFGRCYQVNDSTSENSFDLLPSDGGVIRILGTGQIFKLFPIVNGLLVFAERGVWFITGSQGIGFTANDYTVTKLSTVSTISHTSFVDVLGMPMWWNEEGIYSVSMQQGAGLNVNPVTYTSIASFYDQIPLISKYYARGYFSPVEFKIQWLYRSENEQGISDRYNYSNILNFDTVINAWYPWTISSGPSICGINVLGGKGGLTSPPIIFKYLTYDGSYITFSEQSDDSFLDWSSSIPVDFTGYFVTNYRVPGQGSTRFQLPYITVYGIGSEGGECYVQVRWDATVTGDSGRWSDNQHIYFGRHNEAYDIKRVRIRGRGRVVQLKFSSVSGKPMSLAGWSSWINVNQVP